MKSKFYVIMFVLFAIADALTTWFGVKMGFEESNPLLAGRISSGTGFFGSYGLYTAVGAGVIAVSLRLEKFSPAFRAVAIGMVILKAIPAVNNILLLAGIPVSGIINSTVGAVLENLFIG
ncbi:hypothetical protein E3E28_00640 [Thermococcus sp. 21S9]|nr:hypothetical protein [Thermococcus sp. 21S9]